jgi:AcrB/AcrD/AcrF family
MKIPCLAHENFSVVGVIMLPTSRHSCWSIGPKVRGWIAGKDQTSWNKDMGIVRFALRFPYTFYVVATLILFLGITAIRATRTYIFPEIRIPVVTVIWSYTGLSTPEMEQRVTYSEYAMSTSVSGIKNIEAQTFNGIGPESLLPV